MSTPPRSTDVTDLGDALLELDAAQPGLSAAIIRVVQVLVHEAQRNPRFAAALIRALADSEATAAPRRRRGRRTAGVLEPFAIFADGGKDQLRLQLGALSLEELRDIVAEHGMDHDRLAMKWKTPDRVIECIVDKVSSRSAKGSAFR